jgi:hypothetical protein
VNPVVEAIREAAQPDRYAVFKGKGLQMWLNSSDMESYVEGKGWVPYADLQVGDKTRFGVIDFIGTAAEVEVYRKKYEQPIDTGDYPGRP